MTFFRKIFNKKIISENKLALNSSAEKKCQKNRVHQFKILQQHSIDFEDGIDDGIIKYRPDNFCLLSENRFAFISGSFSLKMGDLNKNEIVFSMSNVAVEAISVLDDEHLILAVRDPLKSNKLMKFNINTETSELVADLPCSQVQMVQSIKLLSNKSLAIAFSNVVGIWDFDSKEFFEYEKIKGYFDIQYQNIVLSTEKKELIVIFLEKDIHSYSSHHYGIGTFNIESKRFAQHPKLRHLENLKPDTLINLPGNKIAVGNDAGILICDVHTGEYNQIDLRPGYVNNLVLIPYNIIAISGWRLDSENNTTKFYDLTANEIIGELNDEGKMGLYKLIFNSTLSHLLCFTTHPNKLIDCDIGIDLYYKKIVDLLEPIGDPKQHVMEYLDLWKPKKTLGV